MRHHAFVGAVLLLSVLAGGRAGAGTTIITHGTTFTSLVPPAWVFDMGRALLAAAGDASNCGAVGGEVPIGTLFTYDPPTGQWNVDCGSPTPNGEIVLLFNWAQESDGANIGGTQGFAEAAADALYAALRDPDLPAAFAAVDLLAADVHFIGHSRGAVVNSDCVERLAAAGIAVDHVTSLDPHPVDGTLDPPADVDWGDATPSVFVNVGFADNYWRADGGGLQAADFDGIPIGADVDLDLGPGIEGAFDVDPVYEHTEVHAWYHGTIDLLATDDGAGTAIDDELLTDWWGSGGIPQRDATGFYYSAVVGGTRPAPLPGATPDVDPLAVYNGDFEIVNTNVEDLGIGYAGWLYHGGDKQGTLVAWSSADPPPGSSYYLTLAPGSDARTLTHNRLYVHAGVEELELTRRVASTSPNDHFRVILSDGAADHVIADAALTAATGWETLRFAVAPALRGQTHALRLEIDGGGDGVEAVVDVDDLHFLPEPSAGSMLAAGVLALALLSRRRRAVPRAALRALLAACLLLPALRADAADPAAGSAVVRDGEPQVRARLLLHPDDVASETVRAGVLFEMAPGWHIYGRDPGDSGVATVLRWRVERGSVGPLAWPPVETFQEADGLLTTYGYSGKVLLAAPIRFEGAPATPREVAVHVAALACKVECVPLELTLRRSIGAGAALSAAEARAARVAFAGGGLPGAPTAAAAPLEASGIGAALLFAFVGGLVLNLMPCVLPVLALKLFALADLARRRRREVVVHTAAYAAGVLATLLALGGLVAVLRSAGTAVGWGFQFQEPAFIAAIATVLVVLSLNLFGVFEIRFHGGGLADVGHDAVGARRSFFEGLLVVVLATPCSAPFLGTAVGFAFASPAPVILAIFAAIGLGLAAPYAAIAAMPGWTRFVPRSGAWMVRLRSALGFVLLLVCVWLVWLFGRGAGSDGMAALLVLLLLVAGGVWWIAGLAQQAPRRRVRLATALLVALTVAGLGGLRGAFDASASPRAELLADWRPYDPAGVARSLADGRPVFVAFTADWCITCKLNERKVLASDPVREAFTRHDVALYVADWTRRDDAIRAELARFGRAGVPLYLAYDPKLPEAPRVLPELLAIDDVIGALAPRAAGDPPGATGARFARAAR